MTTNDTFQVLTPEKIRVTVPAGHYFLGDPCYAVPKDLWQDFCDALFPDSVTQVPVAAAGGTYVLAFSTLYGDGTYSDDWGRKYSVDAGLIGLVPESLIDRTEADWLERLEDLGQLIEFARPTIATCDTKTGELVFGDLRIATGDEDEDEDEDY